MIGSSKYLVGREAREIETILKQQLSSLFRNKDESFIVDYAKILEVIDSVGIKNYTLLIKNHPEDDYKTFHNLILNVKPTNELHVYLNKYMLNEEFAVAYNQGLENLETLRGRVKPKDISIGINPCDEIPPLTIINPSNPGGGDGGGFDPGDPGSGNPSDGNIGGVPIPGVGGGSNPCIVVTLTYECSCGRAYLTLSDLYGAGCGKEVEGVVYYAIPVMSYSLAATCRMESIPCFGDGNIGVVPPVKDPCIQLKSFTVMDEGNPKSTNLKDKIGEVKQFAAQNLPHEVMYNLMKDNSGNYATDNLAISATSTSAKPKTTGYFYGGLHSHGFNLYPMFSWQDVYYLKKYYDGASNQNKPEATIIVAGKECLTCENVVVYALKIDDMNAFNTKINNDLNNPRTNNFTLQQKIDDANQQFFKKFTLDMDTQDLEKLFLDNFSNAGISIYKANDELTNWEKLTLSGNPIAPVTNTPCN